MATAILDHTGTPISREEKPRRDLHAMSPKERRVIRANYDSAQDTSEMGSYWAAADHNDADSAHSKQVRSKLVSRSRYEAGNNGYVDGSLQTYADYLVGVGPTLRMQTKDADLNGKVEASWLAWCKAVQFRRKLWCMAHAKAQDGESFAVLRNNPAILGTELDFVLFETEQCTSPDMYATADEGRIDGIQFDRFGNPVSYDVLRSHPGGQWSSFFGEAEHIPSRFMAHWFMLRRPGQHRAVPEFKSTLNVGATARRWREATVAAAEAVANYAVMLETNAGANVEVDPVSPMSTLDITRKMMTAVPQGWHASQMKAEQPNSSYESFNRSQIGEQSRPKSMPYNLAACDSSQHNYASGRLDHQPFYKRLDIEREDANDLVLEKVFAAWFERAAPGEEWNVEQFQFFPLARYEIPHAWDWPKHPAVDIESEANSNDKGLRNGTRSLNQIYSEAGIDFEDHVQQMAVDYGLQPEEMKAVLLRAVFSEAIAQEANDYGVAVRAGVITPQIDDEEHFRKRMGLPAVNADNRTTWANDGGTRRPITLSTPDQIQTAAKSKGKPAAKPDPSDNPDMGDAERNDNGGQP